MKCNQESQEGGAVSQRAERQWSLECLVDRKRARMDPIHRVYLQLLKVIALVRQDSCV